ncbi:hypothetical protein GF338_06485 [candidate division WOR-3 bacterium]|nr:hypothetical protein [candidate division WOR-3 bacterium]
MKRFLILIALPLLTFGLEKVNLIKDAGFEKDSEVWHEYVYHTTIKTAAVSDRHDAENLFSGSFSGSMDTRVMPEGAQVNQFEDARLTQGFTVPKPLKDIDSLFLQYSVFPLNGNLICTMQPTASHVGLRLV